MKQKNVWIAKELYDEILKSQEGLQLAEDKKKCKKKKSISFLETTREVGIYLNKVRNSKN